MNPRGLICIAILIGLSVIPITGFAKIGDTPERLKEKFGDPIAVSVDEEGCGLRTYRSKDFDEIRVTFVAGKSRMESYRLRKAGGDPETMFAGLRAEYPGELQDPMQFDPETGEGFLEIFEDKIDNQQRSDPWTGQPVFIIGSDETNELKLVNGSKKIAVYSGSVEKREASQERWIIIRTRAEVIELPLVGSQLDTLRSGMACSVTLKDEVPNDLETQMAWVGRRVHLDSSDALDDAHDSLQEVLKVEADGKVLFDRSVCEVHTVPMALREVPVKDTMTRLSETDRSCEEDAPHAREFVLSDWGGDGTAETYICPACLTSFKECKATNPRAGEED